MMRRWLDVLRLRARSLFRPTRVDAELDRELRTHLEFAIEENLARGMTPQDARLAALRAFGSVAQMKDEARDTRRVSHVENILRDLRYTMRGLAREPMLLIAATASIALGAGGNIAVFSLAEELLFTPPDVRRPEQLARMVVSHGSHVDYRKWSDLDASGALGSIAGFSVEKRVNWFHGEGTVSLVPLIVTANFFEVTGVPVALGRAFSRFEASAERDPRVAVVSHSFWQRELGADSLVLGRELMLNGRAFTILGVLAPGVRSVMGFGIAPGIYLPLSRALVPEMEKPNAAIVSLIGRLEDGQTFAQGRAALDAVDRRLGRLAGDTLYTGVQEFYPLGILGSTKMSQTIGVFFLLLGIVSLSVLLIACANVAGLLVARGTARRREIAIRLAIGGSRGRLLQQLLVEGFWLALLGTAIGVALSAAFMQLVNGLSLPIPFPIELQLAPDGRTLALALGLVLLTMLACSTLPAFTATRLTLARALKREEPQYVDRRFNVRGFLLIGQVTASTVLLLTAILFVRNLARSTVTDPGFDVDRTLVVRLGFDESRPQAEHLALLERAVERLRAIPGVEAAAYSRVLQLSEYSGSSNGRSARINGRPNEEHVQFARSYVGPGYFSTLDIRLLQGREFRDTDATGAPNVVVINETFQRRYFQGDAPVGGRISFKEGATEEYEVVGVVSNSKHTSLGEDERAALYFPVRQQTGGIGVAFVFARTRTDPSTLVAAARQTVGALDRAVAVQVEPMRSALAFALLPSQIGAAVLGSLGVLGLALATFGLYAIVSYTVSRRTSEIAIRGALGASQRQVVRLVIRDASILVGIGVTLGLVIATLVTRPLAIFLVAGLSATDPLSFAATALAFLVVGAAAAWLPARRATRVSPVLAMRLE
jgi:predicted permease